MGAGTEQRKEANTAPGAVRSNPAPTRAALARECEELRTTQHETLKLLRDLYERVELLERE